MTESLTLSETCCRRWCRGCTGDISMGAPPPQVILVIKGRKAYHGWNATDAIVSEKHLKWCERVCTELIIKSDLSTNFAHKVVWERSFPRLTWEEFHSPPWQQRYFDIDIPDSKGILTLTSLTEKVFWHKHPWQQRYVNINLPESKGIWHQPDILTSKKEFSAYFRSWYCILLNSTCTVSSSVLLLVVYFNFSVPQTK